MSKEKTEIISKLSKILQAMNSEFPLVDLCEDLELQTNGKFTFLTFRETLDRLYPNTVKVDKIFLLKYINFKSLGITYSSPLISLLYLFRFFEKILNKKILSPILFYYTIAEVIEQQVKMTTLEFIYSIGFSLNSIININEFFQKISQKLQLDDLTSIIAFKGIDFNRSGTIRIEDFVLVIDSYREDLQEENVAQAEEAAYNAELFKMYLEKNFVSIDELYKTAQYNYMESDIIKKMLMKELNKEENYEGIIDSVLFRVSKNKKIFKEDLEKYLQKETITTKPKSKITENQSYWINKYIELIASMSITPKMAFESSLNKRNLENKINLEDLKRTLKILLPERDINTIEFNNMIDAFDVNSNRQIDYDQYEDLIGRIEEEKQKRTFNKPTSKANLSQTLAKTGAKSMNYHLLPVKGNSKALIELKKELEKNNQGKRDEQTHNEQGKNTTKNLPGNDWIVEEEEMEGDCHGNYEEEDGTVKKMYRNDRIYQKDPPIESSYDDYKDEFEIIQAIEHFKPTSLIFTSFDLIDSLVKESSFPKQKALILSKKIDKNKDGFISLIDLINYLLYELKQRSTKLALRYLYLRIYKEFKLNADDFFIKNDIDIYNEININDLSKLFLMLKIESPITKKLYDEMKVQFPFPLIYKNIIELIDEQRDEDKFHLHNVIDNQTISMKTLEEGIKKIVNKLIDDDEYISTEALKAKSFRENIKTFLDNKDNYIDLPEYKSTFIKPLQIDMFIGLTIFQLLKSISPKGVQFITQTDLINFLESYIEANDIYPKDSPIELKIEQLVSEFESNGPPIKYTFENIAFNPAGLIPICEINKKFATFYPLNNPASFKRLLQEIDLNKQGFVTYQHLQTFLYNYSKNHTFSIDLEIKNIASSIIKSVHCTNANDYFASDYYQSIINNYNNISKDDHMKLLGKVCTSKDNRDELFDYLCRIQGKQSGYNISLLCDMVNAFILEIEAPVTIDSIAIKEDVKVEKVRYPEVNEVEEALVKLKLGVHGKVSMSGFVNQFNHSRVERKNLAMKIDKKNTGYVDYCDFISKLREVYDTKIKLNSKLCAMYMFKVFIGKWEEIDKYILSTVKTKDIEKTYTRDALCSIFLFGFAYDKSLFDSFFDIYKEKSGKNTGLLSLKSFSKFIQDNNMEDKPEIDPTVSQLINNKDESKSNKGSKVKETKPTLSIEEQTKIILNNYENKEMPAKNLIDMLQKPKMNLKPDFIIKADYIKLFLTASMNFSEEEADIIIKYGQSEDSRFNLKKFADFIQFNCPKSKINIPFDIIPKIKKQIQMSSVKTYKGFTMKHFNKDSLNIVELMTAMEAFQVSLYETLMLIKTDGFFNVDKLFSEYFLKELFTSNEIDPSLKLSLKKLSDYFDLHKDKLKLFKSYDLDKNGVLSTDEFITALNSFKDLNLNDSQKISILKVADQDKDGRINSKEFLMFISTIKKMNQDENVNTANQTRNGKVGNSDSLPQVSTQNKFYPKLVYSINAIKDNLAFNKKCLKKNNNTFLNYIILLQEDIVKNYNNYECMEQDFTIADEKKEGNVTNEQFSVIMKKRLFVINEKMLGELITFANESCTEKAKMKLNAGNKVNYKTFLTALSEYRFNGDGSDVGGKKGNVTSTNAATTMPRIK